MIMVAENNFVYIMSRNKTKKKSFEHDKNECYHREIFAQNEEIEPRRDLPACLPAISFFPSLNF